MKTQIRSLDVGSGFSEQERTLQNPKRATENMTLLNEAGSSPQPIRITFINLRRENIDLQNVDEVDIQIKYRYPDSSIENINLASDYESEQKQGYKRLLTPGDSL